MDLQIITSITSVTTYLGTVDRKIASVQKDCGHNEVLSDLLKETRRIRRSLAQLQTTLQKPQPKFDKSFLLNVRVPHSTLFQYITTCMIASISGLKQLEAQLKKSRSGTSTGSFFKKSSKSREPSPVADDELAIYCEHLRFYDLAIAIGAQMIECELSLEADKKNLHLRNVNKTHHVLLETLGALQTTTTAISPVYVPVAGKKDSGSRSGSTTPTSQTEPATLCNTATELAQFVLRETDKEFVQKHAGFVPMSPLVEVMTRNSLTQSSTISSVLELSS